MTNIDSTAPLKCLYISTNSRRKTSSEIVIPQTRVLLTLGSETVAIASKRHNTAHASYGLPVKMSELSEPHTLQYRKLLLVSDSF